MIGPFCAMAYTWLVQAAIVAHSLSSCRRWNGHREAVADSV